MTSNMIKGQLLEDECVIIFKQLGMTNVKKTRATPGPDFGADVMGEYGGSKYAIQAKNHNKKQGNSAVQQVVGSKPHYNASRTIVVSAVGFTPKGVVSAHKNNCLLFTVSELREAVKGGKKLVDLIQDYHYPNNYTGVVDLELRKIYEMKKIELKRVPLRIDFDPLTQSRISRFGGITKLVALMGDRPHRSKHTDEQMQVEYKRIRKIIQKTVSLKEWRKHSSCSVDSASTYPMTRLQKECGDQPLCERNKSKQELTEAFEELREKLNRIPSIKELDEQCTYKCSAYRVVWGSYDAFLKDIGVPLGKAKQRSYKKRELVLFYMLLKKIFQIRTGDSDFYLNHTVLERLAYHNKSLISPGTFSSRFKGWGSFKSMLESDKVKSFEMELDQLLDNAVVV